MRRVTQVLGLAFHEIRENDSIDESPHRQRNKFVVPPHKAARYRASSQDPSRCLNGTSMAFLPRCTNTATRPAAVTNRLPNNRISKVTSNRHYRCQKVIVTK